MLVEKDKVIGISYELKADNGDTGMQPWESEKWTRLSSDPD